MDLKDYIDSIPGFPKEGIVFRDITPALASPEALASITEDFADFIKETGANAIVAPEARGFLFGLPAAMKAGLPFYPARKPGKLPRATISQEYDLEYGKDEIQIHADAVHPGDKVVIIDDLLATGGTVNAVKKLVEKAGGQVVGLGFVIELDDLKGRDLFPDVPVKSLAHYEGE